ncbi:hypothetical protein A3J98_02035 [candidate division WS6 bacterium RIFOXYC1_FULL_33_10]|uniref:Uncharacterized protein n=1 Tax=candidate division WS6 bacterium RIFOXYC1_FULL_33_10 TaxID=1802606 RepID=A0A1F4UKN0_9BACT|nr:MAG: hypothetical protein A3J98_02035 [candidate division WS6 bacterium RIFOXYC1_FULL_33_10]
MVTASGLVTFDVQYPEGEEISNDLQVVYSAYGGGYETICVKTSKSLDCDIVGLSQKDGFDIQWGTDSNNENGPEQVVILTTEKGTFLMVIDDGLVDIDQIETVSEEEISTIETIKIVVETEEPNPTSEPIETPTPSSTEEENKCGHFGPHYGTPVNGDEYECQGGEN